MAAIPAPVGQTRRFTPRTAEERRQDVERRAYDLYVQRGKVPGFEQQDWLQAEREVYERDEGQKFG